MTIEEVKRKITSLDAKLDDESISDEEFNAIDKEIIDLYKVLADLENRQELISVKTLNNINEWEKSFLDSFNNGTRKVTIKQAEIFKRLNNGKPFIYNGKRFDCEYPNYRVGFSCLVVRKI